MYVAIRGTSGLLAPVVGSDLDPLLLHMCLYGFYNVPSVN